MLTQMMGKNMSLISISLLNATPDDSGSSDFPLKDGSTLTIADILAYPDGGFSSEFKNRKAEFIDFVDLDAFVHPVIFKSSNRAGYFAGYLDLLDSVAIISPQPHALIEPAASKSLELATSEIAAKREDTSVLKEAAYPENLHRLLTYIE